MAETDQARPLAPAVDRPSSDDEEAALYLKAIRRRKFAKYCGCLTAFILVPALVIIILIFTVFKIKVPVIKMNSITITKFQLGNNNNNSFPLNAAAANMSLTADVSVKNPNAASFKYSNTTTTLYYKGAVIGEARGPPGQAKARRTVRLNVTVDIMVDQITSSPSLLADVGSGLLNVSSYSRVPGRVKILNIIKRHVVVKMNCTFTVNISSRSIQEQKCKRKVKL